MTNGNDDSWDDFPEELLQGVARNIASPIIERSLWLEIEQYARMVYANGLEGQIQAARIKQARHPGINSTQRFGGPEVRHLPAHYFLIEHKVPWLEEIGFEPELDADGEPTLKPKRNALDGRVEVYGKRWSTYRTVLWVSIGDRVLLTKKEVDAIKEYLAELFKGKFTKEGMKPVGDDGKPRPPEGDELLKPEHIKHETFMAMTTNYIEKNVQTRTYFCMTPKLALDLALRFWCKWENGHLVARDPNYVVPVEYWVYGGMERWIPQITERVQLVYDVRTREPIVRLGAYRDFELVHFVKYATDALFFKEEVRWEWYKRLRAHWVKRLAKRLGRRPRIEELEDALEEAYDWWLPSTQHQWLKVLENSMRFDTEPDLDDPNADIERGYSAADRAEKLVQACNLLSSVQKPPEPVRGRHDEIKYKELNWDNAIISMVVFEEVRDLARFSGHFRQSRSQKWRHDSGLYDSGTINQGTGDEWGGAQSRSQYRLCWLWNLLDRLHPHPGMPPIPPGDMPTPPIEPPEPPTEEESPDFLREIYLWRAADIAYQDAEAEYHSELAEWQIANPEWQRQAWDWYVAYEERREVLQATVNQSGESELPAFSAIMTLFGGRREDISSGIKEIRGQTAGTREGGIIRRSRMHERHLPATRRYPEGEFDIVRSEVLFVLDPRDMGRNQKGLRNDTFNNELSNRLAAQVRHKVTEPDPPVGAEPREGFVPRITIVRTPESQLPVRHDPGNVNAFNQRGIMKLLFEYQRTDAILERVRDLYGEKNTLDDLWIWPDIERELDQLPAGVLLAMGDDLDAMHRVCDDRIALWATMKGRGKGGAVRAWSGPDAGKATDAKYGIRINASGDPEVFRMSEQEINRINDYVWRNQQVDKQSFWVRARTRNPLWRWIGGLLGASGQAQSLMEGGEHPDYAVGAVKLLSGGPFDLSAYVIQPKKTAAEMAIERGWDRRTGEYLGYVNLAAVRGGLFTAHLRRKCDLN
jgi:hypothetical protein